LDEKGRFRKNNWEGVKGLLDLSRAPRHIPHKTSAELEAKVVELKQRYFTFSAIRLKELFDLPLSSGAMYKGDKKEVEGFQSDSDRHQEVR